MAAKVDPITCYNLPLICFLQPSHDPLSIPTYAPQLPPRSHETPGHTQWHYSRSSWRQVHGRTQLLGKLKGKSIKLNGGVTPIKTDCSSTGDCKL
jgi:hypothetical protein